MTASELLRRAIGQRQVETAATNGAGVGAAAAPARAPLNIQIPDFTEDESETELPWPGDEASQEELIAYANSQRSIKLLKRVFRAKVTIVAKRSEPR